jgi:hypothetical protein
VSDDFSGIDRNIQSARRKPVSQELESSLAIEERPPLQRHWLLGPVCPPTSFTI